MERTKKKMQIGILVNDSLIPHWSYKMIECIKKETNAEISLAIKFKSIKIKPNNTFKRLKKKINGLLFNSYSFLDKKLNNCSPDAFENKNLKDLLNVNSTYIEITIENDKIEDHKIEALKAYNLDVIIKLHQNEFCTDLVEYAKLGIWSFEKSDSSFNLMDFAGIGEVFYGLAETEIILSTMLGKRKNRLILYKSRFSTDPFCLNRNKNNFYWKASSIIPLKLKELNELGEDQFLKKIKILNEHPVFNSKRGWTIPSNKKMLQYGPKLIMSKLQHKFELTFNFHQWILLFNIEKSDKISTDLSKFQKIIPPRDRFWADPHVLRREDKYYIFFEELIYQENKGTICLIEMDKNGNYTEPVKVLEQDYHLSYPFLIEDNNHLYMIPESKQNNTIELYKCVEFPLKWKLEKVLINNVKAVDTSILFKDNKYWLFCNLSTSEEPLAPDELHLFYSDKLISNQWISHPKNPIVSDFKRSRPAGKFFTFKNKLYRPAQNGLKHYGYGMAINQIIKLTENDYEEELVESILPEWDKDIIGTHTINSVGGLTIIDALIKRKKKSAFF